MSNDTDIDEFDVATACQHLPRGQAILDRYCPSILDEFGTALREDEGTYLGFAAACDMSPGEAKDLWLFFNPEDADTDEYRVLREKAGYE